MWQYEKFVFLNKYSTVKNYNIKTKIITRELYKN